MEEFKELESEGPAWFVSNEKRTKKCHGEQFTHGRPSASGHRTPAFDAHVYRLKVQGTTHSVKAPAEPVGQLQLKRHGPGRTFHPRRRVDRTRLVKEAKNTIKGHILAQWYYLLTGTSAAKEMAYFCWGPLVSVTRLERMNSSSFKRHPPGTLNLFFLPPLLRLFINFTPHF